MEYLFDRSFLLNAIILRMNIMQECLKWHSNRGENDACKTAEDVVARFLAALCGWKLVNLNTIKKNYPAADLGDYVQRLAIQVTVNGTIDKVRETHAKAITHKLGDDFDRLIILFLLPDAPGDPKASTSFIPCTRPKIEKWARPQLDAQIDACSTEKLRDVLAVLKNEMSAITAILEPTIVLQPANLPYTSLGTLFKGRDAFITDLHERLTGHTATLIKGHSIHGLGGVGKTRAAVEYAWRYRSHYTALLFVSADSPETLDTKLAALCLTGILNLPEKSLTDQFEQKAAVLNWLNAHPGWLIILDNADTEDALAAVDQLLPKLSGGHVIITSRMTDYTGGIDAMPLDVLSDDDAAAFLLERTADHRTTAPEDDARALELAHELGGLALALEQSAAHIRNERLSFAVYLELWHNNTAAALHWYNGRTMHYPRSLAVTYQTSVDQLSVPAKEFFRVLSWFAPDPIPLSALESDAAPDDARALLAELENLSLARRDAAGTTFSVHRLVQEITRQQQEVKDGWLAKLIPVLRRKQKPTTLLTALHWIAYDFPDSPDDVRTWPIADPLAPHARAVALHADAHNISKASAILLNQVALLYKTKGQYAAAEPLYRQAIAIWETSPDKNQLAIGAAMNNLATLLHSTNQLAEAEQLMRQTLAIWEVSLGKDHPTIAAGLINLAALLQATNRLVEAEQLMRRALAVSEAAFGTDHPAVAMPLNNLATLLNDTNQLAEAEPLLLRVIEIMENTGVDPYPDLAVVLNNLAALLQATNRMAAAEPLYRRALAIHEVAFGMNHPAVANDLSNLATLLQATNRMAVAEPIYRRALAINEAAFGMNHPTVAKDLSNLATLLQATSRVAEVESLYLRALRINEDSYGTDHPNVAHSLACIAQYYHVTHRFVEAEPLMRRALAIVESALGPTHPYVAISLNNLATLLQTTNRLTEAEPLTRRVVEIVQRNLGKDHSDVATALNNHAQLLRATNRLAEAEPLMRQALAIHEAALGTNHPDVAIDLNNLASLLQNTNQLKEAEPLMRRHLKIFVDFTRATRHDHPHLKAGLRNYCALLMEMGDTQAQVTEKLKEILNPLAER